uniref:G-protein coupled receptors family 1 profile domain-containing protein n=1 Tax=Romanomermis culicivorax TaxID=13658 RepID=A0A915IPA4_ROMCU
MGLFRYPAGFYVQMLDRMLYRMFSNSTAFYSKSDQQDYRNFQCLSTVNLIFVFLTVTICVMSALATFMNALLIRLLYQSKILHPNVRLLLKSLAIAVFLGSLFMFLKFTLYHPFLILVGFQRMLIKSTICALIELPFHVCSLALILSITGIGIERFSATIKQKSDSEKPGRGTKTILIGIWLVAFGNIIAGYLYAYANQTIMCYCHLSLVTTQRIFAVNTMFYVFIEISVLFLFWYVYYRNCKDYCNFTINTARHNLHARFQMINNVETTRTLLPVVVVHALFWTAYLLSLTFVRNFLDIKQQAMLKINCMLAVYHLLPLEMLIQPLLIVRRSEHLKKVALE